MKNTPDKDHIYGLYDPEGSGHTFYATEKERDDAAEEAIQGYLDGTWFDEVEGVFAFTVTAKATQVDVYALRPLQEVRYKLKLCVPGIPGWNYDHALGVLRFTTKAEAEGLCAKKYPHLWGQKALRVVIAND